MKKENKTVKGIKFISHGERDFRQTNKCLQNLQFLSEFLRFYQDVNKRRNAMR